MESDQEDQKSQGKTTEKEKNDGKDHNISHEYLSDVSDLDSVGPEDVEKEAKVNKLFIYFILIVGSK